MMTSHLKHLNSDVGKLGGAFWDSPKMVQVILRRERLKFTLPNKFYETSITNEANNGRTHCSVTGQSKTDKSLQPQQRFVQGIVT